MNNKLRIGGLYCLAGDTVVYEDSGNPVKISGGQTALYLGRSAPITHAEYGYHTFLMEDRTVEWFFYTGQKISMFWIPV